MAIVFRITAAVLFLTASLWTFLRRAEGPDEFLSDRPAISILRILAGLALLAGAVMVAFDLPRDRAIALLGCTLYLVYILGIGVVRRRYPKLT
jgi:hypothetical protein